MTCQIRTDPQTDRLTDTTDNIAFPQNTRAGGNESVWNPFSCNVIVVHYCGECRVRVRSHCDGNNIIFIILVSSNVDFRNGYCSINWMCSHCNGIFKNCRCRHTVNKALTTPLVVMQPIRLSQILVIDAALL